jgi:hypothetical protein
VRGDVLLDVRANVVVAAVLVELRHRADRVVEQRHDVRERVAEEAGDPHGHVDPRPAQLGGGDDGEARHAARRVVPHGAAAEQPEDLGDVVALRAHRRRAPDREADAARVRAGVGPVPGQQRLRERDAGVPRALRGDRLGVDGVEVAAGRQDVDEPAGG